MKEYVITIFIAVVGFLLNAEAAIKEPGWKHCIHPLHALPNQWGKIVSPGFPNGINTQIQCSWVISANPGYRIKLSFHTLNVTGSRKSCYTQFVEILDFKVGHSMGKFCGASRPGDYVSWGSKIRFDLQGDTSGAKTKGFDLRYKATKEPGGFKTTWTFPLKPTKSKKKKKPGRNRPPVGAKPRIPSTAAGPKRKPKPKPKPKPRKPAATEGDPPPVDFPPPPQTPQETQPPPPPQRPQQSRPTAPNRIEFRRPVHRKPGPVIYGEKANARGVDHGHSSVITLAEDEEPELNIYWIIGIAVGGVVLLILIIVVTKICIFDKNKKRKKKFRKEQEQRAAASNQNAETGENIHMAPMVPHGMVPEQYMSEQIMPQVQSYHRLHSLPAIPPTMSSHPYPMVYPYPQSLRSGKSGTLSPAGTVPLRSRRRSTRSRASRRDELPRSKSRASSRTGRSRAYSTTGRKRSRSLQNLPSQIDGWVRVDQPHPVAMIPKRPRPPESDTESSDPSGSSSDMDSDSSRDYRRKRRIARSRRPASLPRIRSYPPPPYDGTIAPPYYVTDKSRDYDEGYDTGRRTNGTKSTSNKRHNGKRKGGRGRKKSGKR